MGLGSSLYSGITGLTAHSERMTIIGNNLANVNTTGFKGSRMHFEDLLAQDYSTVNGVGQVGRGVRVATIYSDFGQGALESTSESLDMAISGDGFFTLQPRSEETKYYTRAGNFRLDKDGYLADPHGYVVQGWAIEQSSTSVATSTSNALTTTVENRIIGVPTDIRLENFQSAPQATSQISIITNLDPTNTSNSDNASAPMFAMFSTWDGTADTPLGASAYAYSTTLKVYDEIGTSHNVTAYFDQVTMSNAGGDTVWEYILSTEPTEDGRLLSGADGNTTQLSQTSAAGVMLIGTMTFRAGQMIGMSAFSLQSNGGVSGGVKDLNSWKLADFSTNGYPVWTANFLGASNASLPSDSAASSIELNFGVRNKDLTSNGSGAVTMGWTTSLGSLASSASASQYANLSNSGWLPSFKSPDISALSTQTYATGGSSTLFQSQDGYTAGVLQNISVSRDGILVGRYSNGQVLSLYSLTLSTFTNKWGLRREGGNLFSESRESGPALTGQAGTTGKGTVDGNSLEMSNVDMATEFVRMITTQRGFQANTKVITTVDSMLGEIIAMKR